MDDELNPAEVKYVAIWERYKNMESELKETYAKLQQEVLVNAVLQGYKLDPEIEENYRLDY